MSDQYSTVEPACGQVSDDAWNEYPIEDPYAAPDDAYPYPEPNLPDHQVAALLPAVPQVSASQLAVPKGLAAPALDAVIRALRYIPSLGTENELGIHLAGLMGGREDAVYDRGEFRRWDEAAPGWVLIPLEEVERAAAAYEGKTYQSPENPNLERRIYMSASKAKGIVTQAAKELARPGFFNHAARGAAFRNGVALVEDTEVKLEPHRRDHRLYAEHVLPFDLLPLDQIKMPAFVQFVNDTWEGCDDIEVRVQYLGDYLGAAMLRITWKHKDNPLFIGAKDSGKSVMLSAIRACFPPRTTTSVTLQAMGDRFGLSPLLGASVNLVTELPAAALEAGEKAKAILVGDEVMVEEKYKKPFPFRCFIGHLFAANEVPRIPDDALRERFALLDFPNVVPPERQDKHLPDKIAAEAQAIASWAVHTAAAGVVARGRFIRPPSSDSLGAAWATDSDTVAAWASETITAGTDPSDFMSTAELHGTYTAWSVGRGERSIGRSEFGRRLVQAGYKRANRGGRGYLVRWMTQTEVAAAAAWKA